MVMSSNAKIQSETVVNGNGTVDQEETFSNAEEHLSATLGYDFEDGQTRQQLELMDDLQKIGVEKYLHLPQLVVMGEQSTGKSSVLQAVTDIPFPVDDKMCTRFATKIVLKRTPNMPTDTEVRIIPGVNETSDRKQALGNWRPKGFDRTAKLGKSSMRDVFLQAEGMIFSETESSPSRRDNTNSHRNMNRLSSSTLRITRSGPQETNFAIVDIPGLVRGRDGGSEHRTARYLVEKYMNNPRSIIVVVIDVVDLERHEIFSFIDNLPGKQSRVIGVINKCDTKQKKSSEWVFDLIKNRDSSQSKHYLKEGWYGLRNRTAAEHHISDRERDRLEEVLFAGEGWNSLNPDRLGRHNLKKALIRMRNDHIKRIIPDLILEIDKKLSDCIDNIKRLGKPRTTPSAQFAMINLIATNYSKMACGAIDGHYKNLPSDKLFARKLIRDNLDAFQSRMQEHGFQKPFRTGMQDADLVDTAVSDEWAAKFLQVDTYKWIRKCIKGFRALEDRDEVNPEVKARLWHEQTERWEQISSEALSIVQQTVDSVNTLLFQEACPDKKLLQKLHSWLQDDFCLALEDAKQELNRILEDERAGVITLNPLKIQKQNTYHDDRIRCITQRLNKEYPATTLPLAAELALKVTTISADVLVNSLIYQNPVLVGILNTHDSIAAYYDVALYRFIDNFALQVVERHLLGPRGPLRLLNSDYVAQKLHGEENAKVLSDLASEEPATTAERLKLGEKKALLEESKKRVQSFKMS